MFGSNSSEGTSLLLRQQFEKEKEAGTEFI